MEKSNPKTLKDVLLSYRPDAPDFGEKSPVPLAPMTPRPEAGEFTQLLKAPPAKRAKADNSEQLRRDLANVSASNQTYFTLCVALLLLLFAGATILVLRSLNKPGQIAGIFGVTGVSFMGIVAQMVRLWKQKVNTDMMLVLAGNMRPQDFKAVVEIVLRSYLK